MSFRLERENEVRNYKNMQLIYIIGSLISLIKITLAGNTTLERLSIIGETGADISYKKDNMGNYQ